MFEVALSLAAHDQKIAMAEREVVQSPGGDRRSVDDQLVRAQSSSARRLAIRESASQAKRPGKLSTAGSDGG